MSSRKEEKERLRAERLAKEAAAAKEDRRRRVLGMAGGGVLAAAAIAAIVVAVLASGGSDGPKPNSSTGPKVAIPAQKITALDDAAKAAGCPTKTFVAGPNDRQHINATIQYPMNPPVFGPHNPTPAHDGNYVGQGAVEREQLVHAMEHGRIVIWYRPNLPKRRISQLETLFAEPIAGKPEAYKQLLVEDDSIPGPVAATSWGQQMICKRFDDKAFDALRAFRARYVDKSPEPNIPFPE